MYNAGTFQMQRNVFTHELMEWSTHLKLDVLQVNIFCFQPFTIFKTSLLYDWLIHFLTKTKPICAVKPTDCKVSEEGKKLCEKLQRQEDDGIFRPKLISLIGTEMMAHVKQLDGILKLYETSPSSDTRFRYLCNEACWTITGK